ncbi:MAG: PAS domain-containing protein [Dongiaceae bacterium]
MAAAESGLVIETPPILTDVRLRVFYEYWLALGREAGGLPDVRDFDPLRLPRLLPNIWIMEVAPDTHRFRMRLAGESINAVYGRNIAGRYFADVFERSEFELLLARYTRTLSEPSIVRATGAVYSASGRFWQGERLAVPMLGRSGLTDTMVGATVYSERVERPTAAHGIGGVPTFYPLRAPNHRAPEIVGT